MGRNIGVIKWVTSYFNFHIFTLNAPNNFKVIFQDDGRLVIWSNTFLRRIKIYHLERILAVLPLKLFALFDPLAWQSTYIPSTETIQKILAQIVIRGNEAISGPYLRKMSFEKTSHKELL